MPMEVSELKAKMQQIVSLAEEIMPELGGTTTHGVVFQQAHTQMVQILRSLHVVDEQIKETERAAEDQELKKNLPKKAPEPASEVDRAEKPRRSEKTEK